MTTLESEKAKVINRIVEISLKDTLCSKPSGPQRFYRLIKAVISFRGTKVDFVVDPMISGFLTRNPSLLANLQEFLEFRKIGGTCATCGNARYKHLNQVWRAQSTKLVCAEFVQRKPFK